MLTGRSPRPACRCAPTPGSRRTRARSGSRPRSRPRAGALTSRAAAAASRWRSSWTKLSPQPIACPGAGHQSSMNGSRWPVTSSRRTCLRRVISSSSLRRSMSKDSEPSVPSTSKTRTLLRRPAAREASSVPMAPFASSTVAAKASSTSTGRSSRVSTNVVVTALTATGSPTRKRARSTMCEPRSATAPLPASVLSKRQVRRWSRRRADEARKRARRWVGSPSRPSLSSRRASATAGRNRRLNPHMCTTSARLASVQSRRASFAVRPSGFSQSTCLRAAIAASVGSRCSEFGPVLSKTATRSSSSCSRQSLTAFSKPKRSRARSSAARSRPQTETSRGSAAGRSSIVLSMWRARE